MTTFKIGSNNQFPNGPTPIQKPAEHKTVVVIGEQRGTNQIQQPYYAQQQYIQPVATVQTEIENGTVTETAAAETETKEQF